MGDFIHSFIIFSVLSILFVLISILFLFYKIGKKVISDVISGNNEKTIIGVADQIIQYQEKYYTDNIFEITRNIDAPNKMIIEKNDKHIIIKYRNLTYNVSTGRYILKDV